MPPSTAPTALIAEDEPLLAQALRVELTQAWPELRIVGIAPDGATAVAQALALQPDVLFLDIRMPGQSGLEAAADLAEQWPEAIAQPFPALVFVTAYDQYAVQAFEAQAVDYLLKPVQQARLRKTVNKLQHTLTLQPQSIQQTNPGSAAPTPQALEKALEQLRRLLAPTPATPQERLTVIQASVGHTLHMVPIEEVIYFEAADKYVRVITAHNEHLIRTSLKELLPQLDANAFWQIHRGTVVQAQTIDTAVRDASGRLHLHLRGRTERLAVSRLYAHRFKAM